MSETPRGLIFICGHPLRPRCCFSSRTWGCLQPLSMRERPDVFGSASGSRNCSMKNTVNTPIGLNMGLTTVGKDQMSLARLVDQRTAPWRIQLIPPWSSTSIKLMGKSLVLWDFFLSFFSCCFTCFCLRFIWSSSYSSQHTSTSHEDPKLHRELEVWSLLARFHQGVFPPCARWLHEAQRAAEIPVHTRFLPEAFCVQAQNSELANI